MFDEDMPSGDDRAIFNNHRGALGRSLRLPGISVAEIHNDHVPMVEHAHDDPHFWLMVRGRYRVEAAHGSQSIGPATLVYTAAGEPHRDHIESAAGFGMTIALSRTFVEEQLGDLRLPERSTIITGTRSVGIARRLFGELRAQDSAARLIVTGLALDLIGQLCRGSAGATDGNRLLAQAHSLIADAFARSDLSVALVARELGVHPVHLARIFRRHAGVSPADYIRAYRCERAAGMLRIERDGLATIALDCGFNDQSSFTRAFRRHCGTTPAAFRRALQ